MGIWTVEGDKRGDNPSDCDVENAQFDEDDTKILLEKEFDDFFEDQVRFCVCMGTFYRGSSGTWLYIHQADWRSDQRYDAMWSVAGLLKQVVSCQVHKSAGPVVFVSKTLGMLPVIWTEDESESECKSYFNLYTFIIFIGIS